MHQQDGGLGGGEGQGGLSTENYKTCQVGPTAFTKTSN